MVEISLRGIKKTYPEFTLGPIDLSIKDGEFFGIVGPPSSGKTSILKLILGLMTADEGEICLDGVSASHLDVDARDISMVFQNLALFPHMTGRENITFAMTEQKLPKAEIEARLDDVSEVLHISHILHKNPAQMSGGERQRIALGRAFASNPRAMLLDEPIAALDARLREEMRVELKRLQREHNQTFVYVSHDEEEVLAISDRVGVMIDGKIAQVGTPAEVYETPISKAVAEVIGTPPMNFFPGTFSEGGKAFTGENFNNPVLLPNIETQISAATLGVRPEDIWLVGEDDGGHPITITSCEPLGSYTIVNGLLGDKPIKIRAAGQVQLPPKSGAFIRFDDRHIHIFDPQGARA